MSIFNKVKSMFVSNREDDEDIEINVNNKSSNSQRDNLDWKEDNSQSFTEKKIDKASFKDEDDFDDEPELEIGIEFGSKSQTRRKNRMEYQSPTEKEVDVQEINFNKGNRLLDSKRKSKEEDNKKLLNKISERDLREIKNAISNSNTQWQVFEHLDEKRIPLEYLVALGISYDNLIDVYRHMKAKDLNVGIVETESFISDMMVHDSYAKEIMATKKEKIAEQKPIENVVGNVDNEIVQDEDNMFAKLFDDIKFEDISDDEDELEDVKENDFDVSETEDMVSIIAQMKNEMENTLEDIEKEKEVPYVPVKKESSLLENDSLKLALNKLKNQAKKEGDIAFDSEPIKDFDFTDLMKEDKQVVESELTSDIVEEKEDVTEEPLEDIETSTPKSAVIMADDSSVQSGIIFDEEVDTDEEPEMTELPLDNPDEEELIPVTKFEESVTEESVTEESVEEELVEEEPVEEETEFNGDSKQINIKPKDKDDGTKVLDIHSGEKKSVSDLLAMLGNTEDTTTNIQDTKATDKEENKEPVSEVETVIETSVEELDLNNNIDIEEEMLELVLEPEEIEEPIKVEKLTKVFLIDSSFSGKKVDGYDIIPVSDMSAMTEFTKGTKNLLIITANMEKDFMLKLGKWIQEVKANKNKVRIVTLNNSVVKHDLIECAIDLSKESLDNYYKEHPNTLYINDEEGSFNDLDYIFFRDV